MTDDTTNKLIVHTDGGARGNPGPAAAAFFATNKNGLIVKTFGKYLGETTNNFAEYQGVLLALKWLITFETLNDYSAVVFFLDSELVTKQLNGLYKVKHPELKKLIFEAFALLKEINIHVSFNYVPRSQNKEADALVNETLDSSRV